MKYVHLWCLKSLRLFLALLLVGSIQGESLERDSIPDKYKWNLSDIYADWESWEQDLNTLKEKMDEFVQLKGTLSTSPDQLLRALESVDDLSIMTERLYYYASLQRDTDTRDNAISARLQQVQILYAQFNTATAWLNPEILTIPWSTMSNWFEQNKGLTPYRFDIEDLFRQQKHVLNEEGEQLLSYFNRFNGTPRAIHSELSTSDIDFPTITLSDGTTVTVTEGKYRYIINTNRNQTDRAKAFEARNGVYNETINTYAAIYNSICQRDWALAQARRYSSTLEASLDDDNVPVEVYENLIRQVRAGTKPLQRYHTLRKAALGLDQYHLYDSYIPLVDFEKTYEYDDVVDMVIESMAPLGRDYQKKLRRAFSGRWVDVYESKGKRSGAYSARVYGVHPYILMNYSNTLDDVFTLAHEMGHSVHTMYAHENQPYATTDYTTFVAEVSSTMAEAFLLDYLLSQTNDPKERIALLSLAINNITGTFYTQVMFADFELRAHRLVEEGKPITAEVLNNIYKELLVDYYADAIEIDELYSVTWARIPHFYFAPYYVYQYATCFASSAKLFKDMVQGNRREQKQARNKYLGLLKSGGNDYPMEQLKKAGVDLARPATIQAILEQMDDLVTKLDAELKRL